MDASRHDRIEELVATRGLSQIAAGAVERVEFRGVSYLSDVLSDAVWGEVVKWAAVEGWEVNVEDGVFLMLTVRDPDHDDA